jgi:hypothetical protein
MDRLIRPPSSWTIKRQLITSFGALVGVAVGVTILVSVISISVTGQTVREAQELQSNPSRLIPLYEQVARGTSDWIKDNTRNNVLVSAKNTAASIEQKIVVVAETVSLTTAQQVVLMLQEACLVDHL